MDNKQLDQQLEKIGTPECRIYAREIFSAHAAISWTLKAHYVRTARSLGYVEANRELGRLNKRLTWLDGGSIIFDDQKIKHLAILYSGAAKGIFDRTRKQTKSLIKAVIAVRTYVRENRIHNYFPKNLTSRTDEQLLSLVVRTFDESFWRRYLRRISEQTVEGLLRELGATRKQTGVYLSNFSYSKRKQNRKRNKSFLESHVAISQSGVEVSLEKAHEASVSNPKNRVAELMVRMRGLEELARDEGRKALFMTITCPSSYHAVLGASGRANPNYQGYSPKEASDYLNSVWQRVRDEANKSKIKVYGIRVCEPHHDGTPHFHFLIYIEPQYVEAYKAIFRKHCLRVDSDEKGAQEHRCDIEELDLENGSPTGYLAKYISKNIDGEAVGEDLEADLDATKTADRVAAWASLWGIRQFSEIGTVPVTVYREARRLRAPLTGHKAQQAERVRAAADKADYAGYIREMGGPNTRRSDLAFRALHIVKEKKNKYGEIITRLLGILDLASNSIIQTRPEEWSIRPAWMVQAVEAAQPPPLEYWQ